MKNVILCKGGRADYPPPGRIGEVLGFFVLFVLFVLFVFKGVKDVGAEVRAGLAGHFVSVHCNPPARQL